MGTMNVSQMQDIGGLRVIVNYLFQVKKMITLHYYC